MRATSGAKLGGSGNCYRRSLIKDKAAMVDNNLPYFGQINVIQLKEYYEIVIEFKKSELKIDLNFKGKSIAKEKIKKIKIFLNNINRFDMQNRTYIDNDFINKGQADSYIKFYLHDLHDGELSRIIDCNDKSISEEDQLLNKLRLKRIGLYPDGKYDTSSYSVFDYSIDIDGKPCDQLLVVNTNENGDLSHISLES